MDREEIGKEFDACARGIKLRGVVVMLAVCSLLGCSPRGWATSAMADRGRVPGRATKGKI